MNYFYVANWKTYLSAHAEITFCKDNYDALIQLQKKLPCTIIICPSFIALSSITTLLKQTTIAIGAQNCSDHQLGAYTGEIAVQSLAEIGITYCIIGHSERRHYYDETNNSIATKMLLLLDHAITPIICIGETKNNSNSIDTYAILTQQLEPIFAAIHKKTQKHNSIIIAYEPIWAIGTGKTPDEKYLETVFAWLEKTIAMHIPNTKTTLLYGGSVNATTIIQLKKIPAIAGFLIGKASTNFTEFAAIIKSNNQ